MQNIKLKKILGVMYPVLVLEDILTHNNRRKFEIFVLTLSAIFLTSIIFFPQFEYNIVKGVFLICFSFYILAFMTECFFYSFYVRSHKINDLVPYEIASILFYSATSGLIKGFLFSDIGDLTMKKLGLKESDIKDFIILENNVSKPFNLNVGPKTVEIYQDMILEDEQFADLLYSHNITADEFKNALSDVIAEMKQEVDKERFWSRENLSKISLPCKKYFFRGDDLK